MELGNLPFGRIPALSLFGRRPRPPWRDSSAEPWNPRESEADTITNEGECGDIPLDIEQLRMRVKLERVYFVICSKTSINSELLTSYV